MPSVEIDIVIENATKVDEIVCVNRFHCVAYLLLEFRDFAFIGCTVHGRIALLFLLFVLH